MTVVHTVLLITILLFFITSVDGFFPNLNDLVSIPKPQNISEQISSFNSHYLKTGEIIGKISNPVINSISGIKDVLANHPLTNIVNRNLVEPIKKNLVSQKILSNTPENTALPTHQDSDKKSDPIADFLKQNESIETPKMSQRNNKNNFALSKDSADMMEVLKKYMNPSNISQPLQLGEIANNTQTKFNNSTNFKLNERANNESAKPLSLTKKSNLSDLNNSRQKSMKHNTHLQYNMDIILALRPGSKGVFYDIFKMKAKEKCLFYSDLFVKIQQKKTEVASSGSLTHLNKSPKMGDANCPILEKPLIVGGEKANEFEFPHQAELGYTNPKSRRKKYWYTCGGSLISDRYVLTAAHCIKTSDNIAPSKVRFGYINKRKTKKAMKNEYDIKKLIPHPSYSTDPEVRYHDIALIKIKGRVAFNDAVRPACLNTVRKLYYPRAIVTGFGKTDFNRASGSKYLMKASIDLIDRKLCEKFEKSINFKLQFCAGVLAGGRDTCQGDSGGPIQVRKKKPFCMYSILGITSYGKMCATKNAPAIYTRVSAYLPWIVGTIWPEVLEEIHSELNKSKTKNKQQK